MLQVVAGPCDPDRCVLSGDALGSCATGVALTLQLQAADRYGNPRSMGGDMGSPVLRSATLRFAWPFEPVVKVASSSPSESTE